MQWVLVLPVKRLAVAKTRLAARYEALRPALALAFAVDTATAALAADTVDAVIAVTDEPAARQQLAALGVVVVPDAPDAGLNPALGHGAGFAQALRPTCGVGALSADLPSLRPAELDAVLTRARDLDLSYVRDNRGTGTVLVLARPGIALQPAFGGGSAGRHDAAGHVDLTRWAGPGLRSDVDTAADLDRALRFGTGARTTEVLGRLSALG